MSNVSPLEDPRTHLQRMRRVHLYRFLRANDVEVRPDMPATSMRRLIEENEISIAGPVPILPRAAEEKKERKLEDLTMGELRALVKELHLTQTPSDSKADLIGRIRGQVTA